ncbi:MAG: ABC transporter ATP-binding protein [Cellulomonas sp.]
MSDIAISIRGLVKDYATVRALDGVDLDVRRGEVLGFLGPNGAGKSTTIRILLDLLRPTAGIAEILGVPTHLATPELRARVGYLPGELSMPPAKTAGGYLHYLSALRGGAGADRIAALAGRFSLDLDREIRGLSKGNKQKVGVVQAFMHSPELLILDEPTSGLDPLLQREFLDLVGEAHDAGATVLMSSHVLSEVEQAAGRVAIIREGVVVDVDDVAELRRRAGQQVLLQFDEPADVTWLSHVPDLTDVVAEGTSLHVRLHGEPDALLKAAAGHRVVRWQAQDRELEDLFLDTYRGHPLSADGVR